MYSKFIYIICCISLLLTGVILGKLLNITSVSFDNLSKFFGILVSIATIFGVLVAFKAINSWRNEFNIKKLDYLINDLEDSCNNLFRSFREHYYAKVDLIKKQNGLLGPLEKDLSMKFEREKFQRYQENEDKYWLAYDKLSRYINISNDYQITPETLNKKHSEIIQYLYEIYSLENNKESYALESSNFKKLIESKESCKKEYRELRIKYCEQIH